MKKNWLSVLGIMGMLAVLIISSVTPALAASLLASKTTMTLSAYSITLGGSVTATARVNGPTSSSPTPAGAVSFQVLVPGASTWSTFSTNALSGGQATSSAYRPSSSGAYWFRAVYSGNIKYTSSRSDSGNLGQQLMVKSLPVRPRR
jgi:hypothetical protein